MTFEKQQDTNAREKKKLQESIRIISGEKTQLELNIADRDDEIATLTSIDTRNTAVMEMADLMKKLNKFIAKTEMEKNHQLETLNSISNVMTLTEELDRKPALHEAGS